VRTSAELEGKNHPRNQSINPPNHQETNQQTYEGTCLSESDTAEEDDDNGDDNSWACSTVISKVNSGTCSFSFEVSHFHAFCDNGDICIEYDIEGIDSDEERDSVVSRLSMENDDSNLRCLECATRVYGGWRHCHDCYRFHYRV
jgi:hypothetical protein